MIVKYINRNKPLNFLNLVSLPSVVMVITGIQCC